MASSARARLLRATQYLLGAGALVWALGQVEWARTATLLRGVAPGTVAVLVAVSVVGALTGLATWHVLLDHVRPTRFLTAVNAGLVVNFVNQLLPSRLSGRAVAPFVVRERTGMDYPSAVAVSGVHTGFHALLYGVIGFAGAVIGLGRLPLGLGVVLLLSVGLYAASGVLVVLAGINMTLVARFVGVLEAVAERVPRVGDRLAGLVDRVPAFTAAAADAFRALATAPRVVAAYAVAWIVSLVFVPGVRMWLLLESLGAGFEPAVLLPVYLLAAYSVTLLPLTPGGIGVTEATATAVFVALGVPEAVVVPAVFADRLLGAYLPAIVGWYPSLRTDFSALVSE